MEFTNKLKIFTIGIVVFLIIVFFLFLSFLPKPSEKQNNSKNFTNTTPAETTKNPEGFKVLYFIPGDQKESYYPDQPIEITFSQNVSKEGVKIYVFPSVEYYFTQGEEKNKLTLYPKTAWQNGETKITILQETVSYNNARLTSPFIYVIHTSLPSSPPSRAAY